MKEWSLYDEESEESEMGALESMKFGGVVPDERQGSRAPNSGVSEADLSSECEQLPAPDEERALVVGLSRGRALLRHLGQEFEAQLSGDIAGAQQSCISVGDEVIVREREAALPLVDSVAERRSCLSRPDPANPRQQRVIAANIDAAVIVLAARRPQLRPRLIDRYRLAIDYGGAQAVVCVTKTDLLEGPQDRHEIDLLLERHRGQGLVCFLTSTETGEGLAALRNHLQGKTSVFVGQSGTGKSSLVNALDPLAQPQELREEGRVREGDGKGRHTTTSSSLCELPGHLRVIDTPGIRGFGLWGIGLEELEQSFPEIPALASACRFNDCSHVVEPGCAVRAALASGELEAERFDTYSRLLGSLEGQEG